MTGQYALHRPLLRAATASHSRDCHLWCSWWPLLHRVFSGGVPSFHWDSELCWSTWPIVNVFYKVFFCTSRVRRDFFNKALCALSGHILKFPPCRFRHSLAFQIFIFQSVVLFSVNINFITFFSFIMCCKYFNIQRLTFMVVEANMWDINVVYGNDLVDYMYGHSCHSLLPHYCTLFHTHRHCLSNTAWECTQKYWHQHMSHKHWWLETCEYSISYYEELSESLLLTSSAYGGACWHTFIASSGTRNRTC